MESRIQEASAKKICGTHNCTQAVACTYADKTGLDEETVKNIGNGFGAGMGNMEGTCGAIVGAGIVYSLATKDKVKAMKGCDRLWRNSSNATGRLNASSSKASGQERC